MLFCCLIRFIYKKDSQFHDGKLVGTDKEGNLYKGVMTFMINSLKKSSPFS